MRGCVCGSAQLAARTQSVFVLCSCYSFAIARVLVLELGPVWGGAVPVRWSLPSCERVRVRRCACGYGTRTAGPCVKEHEGPCTGLAKSEARVSLDARRSRVPIWARSEALGKVWDCVCLRSGPLSWSRGIAAVTIITDCIVLSVSSRKGCFCKIFCP